MELKEPKQLSDEELFDMQQFLREAWKKKKAGKEVPEFPSRTFEPIINYYVLIIQEMQRRSFEYTPVDELDEQAKPFLKKALSPVYPSGMVLGKEIFLKDILKYIKSFLPYPVVAWIVGGLANWQKTKGDIDILWKITDEFPEWFKNVLLFRFYRQFSPESDLPKRIQHHFDAYRGPFTNAVEIYRMNIERINPQGEIKEANYQEPKIVKMFWDEEKEGYVPDDFIYRLEKQLRAGTPEIKRQAEESAEKDEVKVSRFFLPLKPTRGYQPEERQTVDNFLILFKPENFPVWSSKKYDGANHEVHKKGDTVRIYSEDGEDNTDRFPQAVEEFKKLSDEDFVLLDEVELWREGKHLPREVVVGYIHAKDPPDDSELIHNIYNIIYFEKDIHKIPLEERVKYFDRLNFKQSTFEVPDMKYRLNKAPYIISKSIKELEEHTERLRKLPGSEGNVAKFHDFIYYLDGRRSGMIKFHNSAVLNGIVTEVKETKVKDVFNYFYGIEPQDYEIREKDLAEVKGKKYLVVGKTFSTSIKAKVGDVIEVEYETLNLEKHETDEEEFYKVTAWSPRCMKVDGKIDSIDSAVKKAKEGLVFQPKTITEEKEILYKSYFIEKGIRPAFGSPGGKRFLAKKICSYIPEHKIYVEPFVGGGAVFFAKEFSEVEVINDKDSEIAFAYNFIKNMSDNDYERLKKMNWIVRDKNHFNFLKNEKRESESCKRFNRFMLKLIGSYAYNRVTSKGKSYPKSFEGLDRLKKITKQRLSKIKIYGKDYSKILSAFDSENTFFYLDPPYPKNWTWGKISFDLSELEKKLSKIKGKFILSLDSSNENRKLFSKFEIKQVGVPRFYQFSSKPEVIKDTELLISNFPLKPIYKYIQKDYFIEKEIKNPYMIVPDEDESYKYVIQHHYRGRTCH